MTWTEAGKGLWLYRNSDGETPGALMLTDSVWECIYMGEVVAIRPELLFAKMAVEKAHARRSRKKGMGAGR